MARRRGRGWESRDAQCPMRGAGLHHVQDGTPDCVFCGVMTYGPKTTVGFAETTLEDVEAQLDADEIQARLEGRAFPTFTLKEERDFEFLRWLYVNGRV